MQRTNMEEKAIVPMDYWPFEAVNFGNEIPMDTDSDSEDESEMIKIIDLNDDCLEPIFLKVNVQIFYAFQFLSSHSISHGFFSLIFFKAHQRGSGQYCRIEFSIPEDGMLCFLKELCP